MLDFRRMRYWIVLLLAGCILVLATGCFLERLNLPEVQNHPQPTMNVQLDAPWEQGCLSDDTAGGCLPGSPIAILGCDSIQPPGDMLGGLDPSFPIHLCLRRPQPGTALDRNAFLYKEGCLAVVYVRYVIWSEGDFKLVQSGADLAAQYAPIASPDEALSYALAATGLGVRYGLEPQQGYRYYVDELQDTHVLEVEDGYEVLLYDYEVCGCGPHTTYAVTVKVTHDGEIKEVLRKEVYEDPAEDGLCVD
jgi:hypothetical protein